jgi:hypothetical protein
MSCHVAVDDGVWVKGCAWSEKPKQLGDVYREVVKSKMEFPNGVEQTFLPLCDTGAKK